MNKPVAEIAQIVGGTVSGDRDVRISGVNGIREAGPGDITFVRNARYQSLLSVTRASCVLVRPDVSEGHPCLIQVNNPDLAFARILQIAAAEAAPKRRPAGIHSTAVISEDAVLGAGVFIGAYVVVATGANIGENALVYPGSYVGVNARIGPETILYPRVVILDDVVVGARCIIHSGAVLGADGFGFSPNANAWCKVPQIGSVVLGDDVEIGANSTIDRATFGVTRVGSGTKIDNLVQIGHNVVIGEHGIIAGMAGIAGSAVLGSHVMVGARAGVGGHIDIGDNVQIAGNAGVTKSLEPGKVVSGFPAAEHGRDMRIQAAQRMLPEALRRINRLEKRVQELEEQLHGKTADHC